MMARRIVICVAVLQLLAVSGMVNALFGFGPSPVPPPPPGAGTSPLYAICQQPDTTVFCDLASYPAIFKDPTVASLDDPNLVATIFVPTDKAFQDSASTIVKTLGVSSVDVLPQSPAAAIKLIQNHIIVGQALQSSQLTSGLKLQSALGQTLTISTGWLYGTYVKGQAGSSAQITQADILVGRSYLDKIDAVLVPK